MLIGLGERRALVCLSGLLETRGEQITSLGKTNEKMGASDQKWSSQVFERDRLGWFSSRMECWTTF